MTSSALISSPESSSQSRHSPQFVLASLLFFIGLFYVFGMPNINGDEPFHFLRAWALSRGQLVPEKIEGGYTVNAPRNLGEFAFDEYYFITQKHHLKVQTNRLAKRLRTPLNPGDQAPWNIYPCAPHNWFGYLPQAAALAGVSRLNAPPILCYWAGRLGNLLVAVLLIYGAIRITPVGKAIFGGVALVPTSLNLIGSNTPDGLSIALTLFAIAYLCRLALASDVARIGARDIAILVVLAVAVALTKYMYATVFLLTLAIPVRRFGSKLQFVLTNTLVFAGAAAATAYYLASVKPILPLRHSCWGLEFCPPEQMEYLRTHTGLVFKNIVRFYMTSWLGIVMDGVANVGDVNSRDFPFGGYLLFLVYLASFDRRPDACPGLRFKLLGVAACSLTLIAAALSLYVWWTPVGSDTIVGIQGRYFLPIAVLVLLLFTNSGLHGASASRPRHVELGIVAVALHGFALAAILQRGYLKAAKWWLEPTWVMGFALLFLAAAFGVLHFRRRREASVATIRADDPCCLVNALDGAANESRNTPLHRSAA